jgi:hypothetical protein
MLCLEDCLDFCELEHDEVAAIAEHEHVPAIVAAEIGCELLKSEEGIARLHLMILDDIQAALDGGRAEHAGDLANTYLHFRRAHPLPGLHH